MKPCDSWSGRIRAALAGDMAPEEREQLREHARSCPACGPILALHERLESAATTAPSDAAITDPARARVPRAEEPTSEDFRSMRRAVLARTAHVRRHAQRPPRASLLQDLAALFRAHPGLAAGMAVALLAFAFGAGRWTAGSGSAWSLRSSGSGFSEQSLVREITRATSETDALARYYDAPLMCSNATFRPDGNGRLTISFDVTRHVTVDTDEGSPLVRELLVHAMLDPSTVASRLKALQIAERMPDDRLQSTVVHAFRNDPSVAVRLRALEVLRARPFDPAIREALLGALREDEAVQVRMEALDLLTRGGADPADIQRAMEEADRPFNAAWVHGGAQGARM